MSVLNRLFNSSTPEGADGVDSSDGDPAEDNALPLPRYERLDAKEVTGQLNQLSQVELATIEEHERSHQDRPTVLHKLRWLRGSEPMEGYDALNTEQVVAALAGAEAATVRAVREYEFKFQRRQLVIDEAGRVLPAAPLSAGEDRNREEKAERLRTAIRPGHDA